MKDTFKLKHVTIVIDQTEMEKEKGYFYLRATNDNSPLQCYGKPTQIGEWFSDILSRTIVAMDKNNCKIIKIDLSWE